MTTLALLLALAPAANSPADPAPRHNVVFLFADDWGRYASCYAALDAKPGPCRVVKTPNLDALAARGTIFRHAFVNAPSCTPCRSSLLSGRHFFQCGRGAILQGAVWDAAIPSFPLLMKDAGYAIGKTAKVWSPGSPADAPFGQQQHAFQKSGMRFNNFSEQVTAALAKGETLADARAALLAEVRGNIDAMLQSRKPGQPFLYWLGPTTVHRTWVKGSGKKLWGIEPDDLKGKLPKFLPDVPEMREDFADYLGEAQAFDAYCGVVLERLKAAGELDRTVVVASGDHGAPGFPRGKCNLYDFGVQVALVAAWPGGKGGRVVDDFVALPDLCPTFLEIAGVPAPPGLYGKSLVPLLKAEASGQIDPARSFVVCGRERHVSFARAGNLPYPQRSLRNKDYLYIRNFAPERTPLGDAHTLTDAHTPSQDVLESQTYACFPDMDASPAKAWLVAHRHEPQWQEHFQWAFGKRPAEELYHLARDPDQVSNVADDPQHAAARQRLAGELLAHLKQYADPRVNDAGVSFEAPPFTDIDAGAAVRKGKAKAKAKQE